MSPETYFYMVMFLYLVGAFINFQMICDVTQNKGKWNWVISATWMFSIPVLMLISYLAGEEDDDDSKNSGV